VTRETSNPVRPLQFYLPGDPEIYLNRIGLTYLALTAVVGCAVGWFLVRRARFPDPRASWVIVVALGLTALLVHGLVIWVLIVDPTRATGTIPLPRLARIAADAGIMALLLPGYLLQGLLVPLAMAGWKQRQRAFMLATAAVVLYSTWSIPWFAGVLFD